MVLTLTLPEPGQHKRVKDAVLDILSFKWPLSSTKICNQIRREYSLGISHQAVHKSLVELVGAGVLCKNEKDYEINLEWVKKIKKFADGIEKNYKNYTGIPIFEGVSKLKAEGDVTTMTFNSLMELDKIWLKIKKDFYENCDEGEVTFWEGGHCFWLLAYPHEEYSALDILNKKKVKDYVLIHNSKPLDHIAKKFYDQNGIGAKIIEEPATLDMTVFGDKIMQVKLPKDLLDEIEWHYDNHKTIGDIDFPRFMEKVLNRKTKIDLIIIQNKMIADQLKQKVTSEFK